MRLPLAFSLLCSGTRSRRGSYYALRVAGPAAVTISLVLAYPIYVQFFGPGRVSGVIHPPEAFVTDPLNFIVPTSIQGIAPSALTSLSTHFAGNISEQDGYVGLPLVALIFFAVWRYRRIPAVATAGWVGGSVALLSLGGHVHLLRHETRIPLPWWIVEHVPILVNLLPGRLMLYVFLAAGLIAALALSRSWQARRNPLLSGAVALAILIPLIPRVPLDSQTISIPAYFQDMHAAGIPSASVVATVPWPTDDATAPMSWQAASSMRFRILGGYVIGPTAPGQTVLQSTFTRLAAPGTPLSLTSALASTLRSELQSAGVRAVVLGPVPDVTSAEQFLTLLLGREAQAGGGIHVWVVGAR